MDLTGIKLRNPDEHVELKHWPPLQRYLVAGMERRGWTRPDAVALVREASTNAGQPLDRRSHDTK